MIIEIPNIHFRNEVCHKLHNVELYFGYQKEIWRNIAHKIGSTFEDSFIIFRKEFRRLIEEEREKEREEGEGRKRI